MSFTPFRISACLFSLLFFLWSCHTPPVQNTQKTDYTNIPTLDKLNKPAAHPEKENPVLLKKEAMPKGKRVSSRIEVGPDKTFQIQGSDTITTPVTLPSSIYSTNASVQGQVRFADGSFHNWSSTAVTKKLSITTDENGSRILMEGGLWGGGPYSIYFRFEADASGSSSGDSITLNGVVSGTQYSIQNGNTSYSQIYRLNLVGLTATVSNGLATVTASIPQSSPMYNTATGTTDPTKMITGGQITFSVPYTLKKDTLEVSSSSDFLLGDQVSDLSIDVFGSVKPWTLKVSGPEVEGCNSNFSVNNSGTKKALSLVANDLVDGDYNISAYYDEFTEQKAALSVSVSHFLELNLNKTTFDPFAGESIEFRTQKGPSCLPKTLTVSAVDVEGGECTYSGVIPVGNGGATWDGDCPSGLKVAPGTYTATVENGYSTGDSESFTVAGVTACLQGQHYFVGNTCKACPSGSTTHPSNPNICNCPAGRTWNISAEKCEIIEVPGPTPPPNSNPDSTIPSIPKPGGTQPGKGPTISGGGCRLNGAEGATAGGATLVSARDLDITGADVTLFLNSGKISSYYGAITADKGVAAHPPPSSTYDNDPVSWQGAYSKYIQDQTSFFINTGNMGIAQSRAESKGQHTLAREIQSLKNIRGRRGPNSVLGLDINPMIARDESKYGGQRVVTEDITLPFQGGLYKIKLKLTFSVEGKYKGTNGTEYVIKWRSLTCG